MPITETPPPIYFDLVLKAQKKEQFTRLIEKLIENGFDFTWEEDHGCHPSEWRITIKLMWGQNLYWIGRIVRKEDTWK